MKGKKHEDTKKDFRMITRNETARARAGDKALEITRYFR
ncbi:hypothetical protein AB434_0099 [Heyndrickxia coagulans]|jgi:hypothetical protein|uniref:Uncharacterized protein n=1 Tax=Heyndrickxia coagulans TaxID=1398 RepID=A0AAN0T2Y6_HEYCO|nr:hypothetical protein SB48_HM08orf01659 [Heyndrickxia coagulans]AKN52504.1 hypothetical protein AB434_0099 [Heyndrickxia coagulans]KYC58822.1 hypothetical protein B4100_2385 [Heyndrickxia coagulans]KYC79794.1 hypothetical protein B4096_2279 [Heyndrickxia coagulans]